MFYFVFFNVYLCEKNYKLITIQYVIANCVSWVPKANLVGFTNKLDLRMCFFERNSFLGDLLYRVWASM